MTLHERIHAYILKNTEDGKWLLKESITAIAASKGYTPLEILDALGHVHKMSDIQYTVHKDTLVYRKRQAPKPKAPPPVRLEQTAEQKAMIEDCIENCPLVSDAERACMRTRWKDWDEACHLLMDNGVEYDLYMERKHGAPRWKRMKEERAVGGMI